MEKSRETQADDRQDRTIEGLLSAGRVIAVVGLSANPDKASNTVARYLMEKGYKVIPVNPGRRRSSARNRTGRWQT